MKKRFISLDVLKAIAIIAVVLYHFGCFHYGYLGVDIFLVVNGFLLYEAFENLSTFGGGYKFLVKRILRLYPLTLIATAVCLLWGSYWMLPYQFQDLAQSVIATDLFANNILMSIKSADYWNVLNDYKPLMHTWYLGIIVQFYFFFALIVIVTKKIIPFKQNVTGYIVGVCFLCSLILYLLPNFTVTQKFYYLPFRVFEFCAGCLTASWIKNHQSGVLQNNILMSSIAVLGYVLLICLLFINVDFVSSTVKLLATVALTCVLLAVLPHINNKLDKILSNRWLAIIGQASFSIYIWHQIVFAFCRYSFTSVFDIKVLFITCLITGILSFLSFNFVEKAFSNYLKKNNGERNTLIGCLCAAIILLGTSFYLNSCSGVIRDVPELDTFVGQTTDRMHISYNEEAYEYDRNFNSSEKLHWTIVGDSYGRDFVNILREMGIEDRVELSYMKKFETYKPENKQRIKDSDLVFRTMTIIPEESTIDRFYNYTDSLGVDRDNVIIVGSKRFGHSLGQVYAKRHRSDYFSQTVEIEDWYFVQNDEFKEKCRGRYIDLITPVRVSDKQVRVFTDNHKVISQDCEHLTKNGAIFYADYLKTIIEKEITNKGNK